MNFEQDPQTSAARPAVEAPPLAILNILTGAFTARALHVAAALGVADHLAEGPRSAVDLADRVGADATALHRLLRALASIGVFTEVQPGVFGHTALSACLRSDVPHSMSDLCRHWGGDWFWRAWEELEGCVRTGTAAIDRAFGEDLFSYFEHQNPEAGSRFSRAMANISAATDTAIVAAYDFASAGTLADVGGAHGSLLCAILAAYPTVHGVLFDRPEVIAQAQAHVAASAVRDRVTLLAGDFFRTAPPADTYLLRMIVHDWGDRECVTILRNCRQAMRPGGRLLVIENVLSPVDERSMGKLVDLVVLVMLHGRERTAGEFRTLFAAAGFELTRILPTQAFFAVVEGIAR
jgi:hypothetical protein